MREISAMFFSRVSAVLLLSTLSVLKSWKEGRNVLEQVLIGIQTELWVTASSSEAEKELILAPKNASSTIHVH